MCNMDKNNTVLPAYQTLYLDTGLHKFLQRYHAIMIDVHFLIENTAAHDPRAIQSIEHKINWILFQTLEPLFFGCLC